MLAVIVMAIVIAINPIISVWIAFALPASFVMHSKVFVYVCHIKSLGRAYIYIYISAAKVHG